MAWPVVKQILLLNIIIIKIEMRKLTLLILWLISIGVKSQTFDFNNYKPLQSAGTLPKEFTNSSTEKYNDKKGEIAKGKTQEEREAKDQYYLESSFALDDILKSGKVLFNDTISNYLTAVMAKILENRETKKDVRVFCIKSAVVNAYTTGNGIVFVTTGLLARVRTEAQLAFILSHEYMHYVYKHSIKGYIESKKIVKGAGDYHDLSIEKKYLARQAFSREQESEADLKGFELFAKSDYSFDDVDSSFQVLKYSYLPFGLAQFKKEFVETPSFKIPDSYWLTDISPIDPQAYDDAVNGTTKVSKEDEDPEDKSDEDEEDKASTHPSIDKRLDDLHDAIHDQDKKERKHFIVSENAFFFIRKVARFELVRLNLLNQSYEGALYNSYNLLQDDPNSKYLRKSVAKALYGITMYANTGNMSMIHVKKKYTQGEWQQLPNLVGKLKAEGVSVWALNYIWQLKKEYPMDTELKLIFDDVMKSFIKTHVKKKRDFVMSYEDTAAVTTKYKKLKPFIRLGLLNLFVNDPEFKTAYENAYVKYSKEKKESEEDEDVKTTKSKTKKEKEKEKETGDGDDAVEASKDDISIHWDEKLIKGNTKYVGDGKVMMLTPRFSSWTIRGWDDGTYNYIESEQGKEVMINSLQKVLPLAMPSSEVIDRPTAEEVTKLNEISLLNDWVGEKMENGKLNMIAIDYERVQKLAAKHQVDNLLLMSVSSIHEKKEASSIASAVVLGALLFPTLPFVVYYLAKPKYTTHLYFISLNFKQDKIINTTHKQIDTRATTAQIKSQVYAHLLKLKKI